VYNETSGKAAWEALRIHHQTGTMTSRLITMKKLNNSRLEEGESMTAHWTKMTNLFNRLSDLGNPLTEEQKITYIINSVEDDYEATTSGILTWSAEQLTMARVKEKLLEAYERKKERKDDSAMRARFNSRPRPRGKSGFNAAGKPICYECEEEGHIKRDCPKLKKNQEDLRYKLNRIRGNKAAEEGAEYVGCFYSSPSELSSWVIDSGATSHVTADRSLFTEMRRVDATVVVANGEKVKARGAGKVEIRVNFGDKILVLHDVLWVPEIDLNLLSVQKLAQQGHEVLFESKNVYMIKGDQWNLIGKMNDRHYRTINMESCHLVSNNQCIHDWHRALGHRNLQDVRRTVPKEKIKECKCSDECQPCIIGKMSRKSFPKAAHEVESVLDVVVSDICGPMQTESVGRKLYFITFIDVFSGYCQVVFIRNKSEATQETIRFIEKMKTQLNRKPKIFRSDRGKEYLDGKLVNYLKDEGIKQNLTVGYCGEQNGVAERRNRTLVEAGRTLRNDANLPKKFWAEAISYANYTQNRIVNKKKGKTPFELLFGKVPRYDKVHRFGSDVLMMIPAEKRRKLDEKAKKMKFIGYDEIAKGYRVTDGQSVIVSREIKFLREGDEEILKEPSKPREREKRTVQEESDESSDDDDDDPPAPQGAQQAVDPNESQSEGEDDYGSAESDSESSNSEASEDEQPRRSNRQNLGQIPARFNDFQMYSVASEEDPNSFKQAMESADADEWKIAIKEELDAIESNGTWELVDLPAGRKAIGSKWVFKTKRNDEGNPVKRKARCVAQGFSQKYGIDYLDVYAPVARNVSLRMMLSTAGRKKLIVKQYDVKSAFLNGDLQEEIFMKPPPGTNYNGKVCKLVKSLYGLKQAANVWNAKLHESLVKRGCVQNETDNCLYLYTSGGESVHLLAHVDDILAATSSEKVLDDLMASVGEDFGLKCMGEAKEYLGIKLDRDNDGNFRIWQPNFIKTIIEEAGQTSAKTSRFPMDTGYFGIESEELKTNEEYRRLIGMLLYLATNSRPDIAAPVIILSQRVSKPRKVDLNEAKRIVRYLKGTIGHKLRLSDASSAGKLEAFSDSDWANDPIDRKSNTGWLVTMNGGAVSWSCRKQNLVAMSSAEAEYIGLTETAKEIMWIKRVAKQFGFDDGDTTTIHTDSQSAMAMVNNQGFSGRTKHIDIRCHFIREASKNKIINLAYHPTATNIADLMTKPLGGTKVKTLRELAGLNSDDTTVEEECWNQQRSV
jgi:transposase InsO family protein